MSSNLPEQCKAAGQRRYYPTLGMSAAETIEFARAEIAASGGGEDDPVIYAYVGDTPCTMRRIEAHIRRVDYIEYRSDQNGLHDSNRR